MAPARGEGAPRERSLRRERNRVRGERSGGRKRLSGRRIAGPLLVAPSVLAVLALFVAPLVLTGWMSLHDWSLFGQRSFIGFENYREMADDSTFRSALVFTLLFALLATAGTTVVGLALALLVRNSRRGISFFRTSYFLPVVIGFATASFLWVWLFNDQVGPLDAMLRAVGVVSGPVGFLSGPTSALFSIVGMTVWKSAGFAMLVFLVGLQAIPEELYEAARIDGAGRWSLLRYITMPLLRPALALVLVLMLTQNFLAFDQFLIMTRGGPSNSTITAVYWIYNNAFVKFDLGYAAAIAIVLLVALVAINYVQLRAVREEQTQ